MILYFVVIDMNWWPIIAKLAAIFPTVAVENCMFYAVEYLSHLERCVDISTVVCVDISTVCCTYCAEPGCSLLGLVKGKFNLLENETKLEISRIRKWRKLGEFYRISWIFSRRRKLFTESLIAWFYYHLEYFKFCVDILINWWFIFGYPHPWKTHSFHLSHFWAAFYTFYSALKIKL